MIEVHAGAYRRVAVAAFAFDYSIGVTGVEMGSITLRDEAWSDTLRHHQSGEPRGAEDSNLELHIGAQKIFGVVD